MTGDPSDMSDLLDYLDEVRRRAADPSPLARAIGEILVEQNLKARLAGVDAEGRELVPVKSQRGRPGPGPPLAPRGAGSRSVTDFEVQVIPSGEGEVRVVGTWPRFGWILALHAVGAGRLPVRDIIGEPRRVDDLIDVAVSDYGRDMLHPPSRPH